MRITKYGHSCLTVEDGDARLLLDPGNFSSGFEGLTGLTGILVTHQHPDHLDRSKLPALLAANPDVPLYTDPQTAELLAGDGIRATAVAAGESLPDLGVEVTVHGKEHAVIHRDLPLVDNVSYLVGGRLLHPGDALHVPDVPVEILALPAVAPWMALKEAIDYLRAVGAPHAFPIHTAVASDEGLPIYLGRFEAMGPEGATFHNPAAHAAFEL